MMVIIIIEIVSILRNMENHTKRRIENVIMKLILYLKYIHIDFINQYKLLFSFSNYI
jgi:hypothetical protein